MTFFIPCLPPKATSQQKGAVRTSNGIRFYKKKHVAAAEADIIRLLRPHAPSATMAGDLSLVLIFTFPWRASENKGVITRFLHLPITTKPDCSNIVKMVEDAMTRLMFWNDDSQVAELRVVKRYGDTPGIECQIMPVIGDYR